MNITVNPSDNTLRFSFADRTDFTRDHMLPATIDIGEEGRLLGLEIDITNSAGLNLRWPEEAESLVSTDPVARTHYLAIEPDSGSDALARSVRGTVAVVTDDADRVAEVILPRRGAGYEITYPSGNR
ncbi:MAG TPA: hypothetical protein VFL82_13235 [Thermomicrobiales bacterium]|nr:hypothetical protein [Thermomicrobiales bacterium]